MKNILWGIGTSVMGSFAFHWISNGPKINIPSDVWVILLWAIPLFLSIFLVTTQPRQGSCLKRNGHRLKRPKMNAGKRESSIYTP